MFAREAGMSGKWLWLKVSTLKGNENIQESDSGHDCTPTVNILKPFDCVL